MAMNFSKLCKRALSIRRHGWKKPPEGWIKLNVDAAFSANYFTGATGAVLRDEQGMFIAGSCCGIPCIADAATAEARALRDGLLLAGQVGCNNLIVNSDCMDVIETMRNGGNSRGGVAAIYEEFSFLARNFTTPVLRLVHRR
jgi:ribonuclease HI